MMTRQRRRAIQGATIRDVADRAGVSPMTVSRVINRETNVRAETRDLVNTAIRELNYSPSAAARSLAGSEPHRVGVLYHNPSTGYLSEFLLGVLDESSRTGTQIMVEKCPERDLTEPLLSLGHRRFGFITGHPNQTVSAQRLSGFLAALVEAGIDRRRVHVEQGYFTYRSGLEAAEKLLADRPRPTAIFAANDDMAAATSSVAHRLGLDVPSHISIVGFDDTPMPTLIPPALTTIHQP